ncbi:MAG: serine/threonine dehydratase, partial [Frankiales bacterium]|nr:serine/threonine dehydratase [Frankiales bacterium]
MSLAPTFDDVESAAARIAPYAARTPVMRSRVINEQLGAEV